MDKLIAWMLAFLTSAGIGSVSLQKPPESVEIIVTGDVMLGRTVMTSSLDDKKDPTYPFHLVADTLKSADLTFINLENPIIKNCPKHYSGFKFCADPRMIRGLTYAGIDIVSLANNHSKNYGQNGVDQTVNFLKEANIESTGLSNLIVKEIEGIKFGFLGFEKSQLGNPKMTVAEANLIKQSDKKVDVLIVAMHWGIEYKNTALPGVRSLARELVDLGADVIVGSHPHWVQDWETIDNVPVFYSLGNFIFDQMWSENTRKGMAIKLVFEEKKLVNQEFLPTYMQNHAQPMWVSQ